MRSLSNFRREYHRGGLTESTSRPNPVSQFQLWFDQAVAAGLNEPNAMTLATAGSDGIPSARIVLLKAFDETGFVFYTNYQSAKGAQLQENPRAALVFYWGELERQVRITGNVEKTSREESATYFKSRPRESQLGAHVSHQGEVISSREELEQTLKKIRHKFEGQEIPLPDYWGGYRVVPQTIEFWQGGPGRLHDRLRYRREKDSWILERLCP